MKKVISSLALIAAALTASATPRSAEDALAIARLFVSQTPALTAVNSAKLSLSPAISARAKSINGSPESPAYYIINIEDEKGFVVVSGDDRFTPVLGFSEKGSVESEVSMPEGLQYWLSFLSAEMDAAISAGYQPQAKVSASVYKESVAPLLTSKWGQTEPFNKKIPNYATGCVATGTAQVMYYWKYPQQGIGNHTNGYFTQYSADFANTTYDWDNMKDVYGGKYDTPAQVDAVATLMYQLGVATDMRWAKPDDGSGTPNMYAGNALINFFGYNQNLYAEQRDCLSLGAWKALVIEQLQTGHPLCYAGMTGGPGAGHFFVLDGYDAETGLFHFNWGWDGKCDGYYNITALEPGVGGVGAGIGTFNYDQQMFVNVQPTKTGEYVAHFDASEIRFPDATSVSNVLVNVNKLQHNSINFKGNPGLAIYNADGSLYMFKPSGNGFPAGFNPGSTINDVLTMDFNLSSVADGNYTVCLATLHDNYLDKPFPIRAYYGNPTYFTMSIASGVANFTPIKSDYYLVDTDAPIVENAAEANTLYENVKSTFQVTIKNTGTTAFFDEVGVCVKKQRGGVPMYITVPCSLEPGETKTLIVSGMVTLAPGNYYLYACYGENGNYSLLDNSVPVEVKDNASGIVNTKTDDANASIYSVSGVRVMDTKNLQRGIYIQNGKKIYR